MTTAPGTMRHTRRTLLCSFQLSLLRKGSLENHFQKITGIIEDASHAILAACGELNEKWTRIAGSGGPWGLGEWDRILCPPSSEQSSVSGASGPGESPGLEALLKAGFHMLGWLPWCVHSGREHFCCG